MDTGHQISQPDRPAGSDSERFRDVLDRRAVFNALERPTLGDLAESGLYSYAGRLSDPQGWWHCPSCWMDYATKDQYREAA